MKRFWIARAARFIVFAAVGIVLFGLVLMSLWNSLVPGLFGGPAITFGQALGLFVLSRVLFFPFRGGWRLRGRRREGYFRKRFEEKLASMTPEERERIRSQYANCCGGRRSRTSQEPEEVRVRTEEPANV